MRLEDRIENAVKCTGIRYADTRFPLVTEE
jgi:hypothetical protein